MVLFDTDYPYPKVYSDFADMTEDPTISKWLDCFSVWDSANEEMLHLNNMQKHDINLMLQKRYGLLQWEQGSGKTLAGIAVGLYRIQKQNIHYTCVAVTEIMDSDFLHSR